MKVVNMQTEDYKKYVFTEQTNGSWLLTWEDCGEEVSEIFTEEEKKEIPNLLELEALKCIILDDY